MKEDRLILIVVVIAVLIGFSFVIYISQPVDVGVPNTRGDILRITNAYTNATENAVFVDVTAKNNDANIDCNITRAIIYIPNNSTPIHSLFEVKLSTLVLHGQSATLRINCTLASGNYTVRLVTSTDVYDYPFIVP